LKRIQEEHSNKRDEKNEVLKSSRNPGGTNSTYNTHGMEPHPGHVQSLMKTTEQVWCLTL